MSTVFQTHEFSNLPIKVSGGDIVARVSGSVSVKRRGAVRSLYGELHLRAENGGIIEVPEDDGLYDVVVEALERDEKSQQRPGKVTSSGLDDAEGEGAQTEPG